MTAKTAEQRVHRVGIDVEQPGRLLDDHLVNELTDLTGCVAQGLYGVAVNCDDSRAGRPVVSCRDSWRIFPQGCLLAGGDECLEVLRNFLHKVGNIRQRSRPQLTEPLRGVHHKVIKLFPAGA